jgi:hypothetical protein
MLIVTTYTFAEPVEKAATSLIGQGVLGTLVVLVGGACFWLILQWRKVQNDRIQDRDKMSEKMESLITKMTTAFGDMSKSIDNLTKTTNDTHISLSQLNITMDSIIREAIRGTRKYSPPGGTPISGPPK